MRPIFPILPDPQSECLFAKFSPRSIHIQERFLVILSCQIDELLFDLLEKSDDIQLVLRTVLLVL